MAPKRARISKIKSIIRICILVLLVTSWSIPVWNTFPFRPALRAKLRILFQFRTTGLTNRFFWNGNQFCSTLSAKQGVFCGFPFAFRTDHGRHGVISQMMNYWKIKYSFLVLYNPFSPALTAGYRYSIYNSISTSGTHNTWHSLRSSIWLLSPLLLRVCNSRGIHKHQHLRGLIPCFCRIRFFRNFKIPRWLVALGIAGILCVCFAGIAGCFRVLISLVQVTGHCVFYCFDI